MLRGTIYRTLADCLSILNGRETISHAYNELNKMQGYSEDKINQIIFKKTQNLVDHADKNLLYYHELFKRDKIEAMYLKNLEDINTIPVLTKKIIRENFPERIVDKKLAYRAHYNTTSGSTGDPLEFYMDQNTNPYSISSIMYFNRVMGVKEFDVHWNLKTVLKYTSKEKFLNWLMGKHLYSVLDLQKENLTDIINQIDKIKPNYLECYSASIEKLARFLYEENLRPKHKPKATIATSEMLTSSGRELVEQVLQTEVFDRYGFREFSAAVAQECKLHNGLHISPLLTYIEIVDENNESVDEGEEGRILVTDLNNMVMPFIRYETGDFGVKGSNDCPCGLRFPMIQSVKGRIGDFFIASNGDKIPFVTVSHILFGILYTHYIYTYQFTQKQRGVISLKIVPTAKFSVDILKKMEESLLEILPGFESEIHIVDDIPPESTGKTPFLKK